MILSNFWILINSVQQKMSKQEQTHMDVTLLINQVLFEIKSMLIKIMIIDEQQMNLITGKLAKLIYRLKVSALRSSNGRPYLI
jgi:hypothetical protein